MVGESLDSIRISCFSKPVLFSSLEVFQVVGTLELCVHRLSTVPILSSNPIMVDCITAKADPAIMPP